MSNLTALETASEHFGKQSLETRIALSQAISLKRIADALSPPDSSGLNINAILYEIMQAMLSQS